VRVADGERDDLEQDLLRRARDAGFRRLDEIGGRADADADVIEHAKENADRMWHSLGFQPRDGTADKDDGPARDANAVNTIKDEVLAAAREQVVNARTESGIDPAIADRVLRRLDTRGSQPE
jgi:CPA1 family monovalent cation:H+ antiporter